MNHGFHLWVFILGITISGGWIMARDDIKLETPGACQLSDDELKSKLSPEQFQILKKNGTERPFANAYWNNKRRGLYVDVISGEPLFSSEDKFDSGSGWPSFTKPVQGEGLVKKSDSSHGMQRVEVRSKKSDSHLGHVFDDGPKDRGGLRYCINSASLRFIPYEELDAQGYGAWKSHFDSKK